jgi:hypothetical protein
MTSWFCGACRGIRRRLASCCMVGGNRSDGCGACYRTNDGCGRLVYTFTFIICMGEGEGVDRIVR